VIRALSGILDFGAIKVGQKYRLHFAPDGSVDAFRLDVSRLIKVRVEREAGGGFVGKKDETQTRIEVDQIGGRIESSLNAAVKATGEDTALVSFFVDVFAYDLNFYIDQHKGDTFRAIVEKEMVPTADGTGEEFLRYRRIVAAEYAGKAGTFRAFWWKPTSAKDGRYYNEKGESVEKSLLKTPLKYTRISSKFDPKRFHPVLHREKAHMGIDYAAPTGTPIWAAASGTIVSRGPLGGAGNCVILRHDGGMTTLYMHMSKFAAGQKVGQRVSQKTVIGFVGMTGLATGPHLHFGVKMNGTYIDPMKLKPIRAGGVARKDMAAFKADTAGLVGRLAHIEIPSEAATAAADAAASADEARMVDVDEPAAPAPPLPIAIPFVQARPAP
jgi:murein DD-endopeptidase MepM/ murein hydrolase activator NlpD